MPGADWHSLVDPDSGRLRSRLPLDGLIVAERVRVAHGVLHFEWRAGFDYVTAPPTLLEQFLVLKTDDAVVSFAKRFGPLGLSEDGTIEPRPLRLRRHEQRESLATWRRYQREFKALLALIAALRERESPKLQVVEDLQTLGVMPADGVLGIILDGTLASLFRTEKSPPGPSFIERFAKSSKSGRLGASASLLQWRTNALIRSCRLRPALTFESAPGPSSRCTLVFQDATADHPYSFGISLFGALTVQLMAAVTGTGFALCSACGSVFVPRRRQPAYGKRRYCRACGRGEAVKAAKATYRHKLREFGVRKLGTTSRKRARSVE